MSYVKKDEDADQVMMKLDRTSVFQDGKPYLCLFKSLISYNLDLTSHQHGYSIPHPYHHGDVERF